MIANRSEIRFLNSKNLTKIITLSKFLIQILYKGFSSKKDEEEEQPICVDSKTVNHFKNQLRLMRKLLKIDSKPRHASKYRRNFKKI